MEEKQKQTEERNDNAETVIEVTDLCKVYKLYNKPTDRLKESLGLSRKKQFKEHYALKHVDLTIKKGESVGIIGTNGSGKSTILKIITGVLSKTSGDVKVNGRISALLELGAGFNMEYTGIENIYLNGTMIGFTEAEIDARLQDILDLPEPLCPRTAINCPSFASISTSSIARDVPITLPSSSRFSYSYTNFSVWIISIFYFPPRHMCWKLL